MGGIKKIMIVEDSELLHRMYDLILMGYRKTGAEVLHAFNGREALNKLSNDPDIHLIILDINMPVMSGLEFLSYCKREKIFQEIPVIIVSTEGKEDDTIRGLKAGAKGYITKPFQAVDLYRIIDKVIGTDDASASGIHARIPRSAPVGGR